LLLAYLPAGNAVADQNKPAAKDKASKKPAKAAKQPTLNLAVPTIDPARALDLLTVGPGAQQPSKPAVDLFPPYMFGRSGLLAPPPKANSERRRGLALGNDTSWKVHAAQIGAMALGWGVLAALCSGGNCMIPDNWVPGPLRPSKQIVPNPVRPPKRGARNLGR
jgi:hypothetical protein